MNHEPWPETGCTLAEARERTTDRDLWEEWRGRLEYFRSLGPSLSTLNGFHRDEVSDDGEMRRRLLKAIKEKEALINAKFHSLFCKQQLIAVGRRGSLDSEPEIIAADIWPALDGWNWKISAAGETRKRGTFFLAVKAYPIAKAPNRVALLSGCTLQRAFREAILDDPEVSALGSRATKIAPQFQRVFRDGCCSINGGGGQWPLGIHQSIVGNMHHDEAKRGAFEFRPSDPRPVNDAADALKDRFEALIGMLRNGVLEGHGLPADGGSAEAILASVWSHNDFIFDAWMGDILAINEACENPRLDLYKKRWLAVLLKQPATPATAAKTELVESTSPSSRRRVEASARAVDQCREWLKQQMRTSPGRRVGKKAEWWARARERWPDQISRRAFDDLWADAVRTERAFAWSSAGAPRKPQREFESAR